MPALSTQVGLWLEEAGGGGWSTNVVTVRLWLAPECDRRHLERAVELLVRRHENLRVVLELDDASLLQVVTDGAAIGIARHPGVLNSVALDARIRAEMMRPFRVLGGPLTRIVHFELDDGSGLLLILVHHLVFDGGSVGVLARDFGRIHAALVAGTGGEPAPPPVSYAHLVLQEQGREEERRSAAAYWRKALRGVSSRSRLRLSSRRPAADERAAGTVAMRLAPFEVDRVRAFAQQMGVTPFMLHAAAVAALYMRYAGDTEMVFALPVSVVPDELRSALTGLFTNLVPLNLSLDPEVTFQGLLHAVRAKLLRALMHGGHPFHELVRDARWIRTDASEPILPITVNYVPTVGLQEQVAGYTLGYGENYSTSSEIQFTLAEVDQGYAYIAEYNSGLYTEPEVAGLMSAYRRLLLAMVESPGQVVAAFPMCEPQEAARIVAERCVAAVQVRGGKVLGARVDEAAAARPDAIAVVDGERSITYGELMRRSAAVAMSLAERGIGQEDRVAVCMHRGIDFIVAVLGVLKCGAAFVPVQAADARGRVAEIIEDAAPAAILCSARSRLLLHERAEPVLPIEEVSMAHPGGHVDGGPRLPPADAAAYVMYTSGSSGKPKGVVVEHAQLASFVEAQLAAGWMGPDDRVLHFASIAFDTCIGEIFPALCAGARLVVRPDTLVAPDAEFRRLLVDNGISYVDVPTAFWNEWVGEISAHRFPVLPSLRTVVIGGEAASSQHVRAWFDGPYGGRVRLINAYGPTENTVTSVFAQLCEAHDAAHDRVRIGRPMANARVYILDGHGQLVPAGARGEIHIGGAGVARGYLNRPELSAERFVPDPFSAEPGARMYRTGDMGRWRADGQIEYLGRDDSQVKVRGFRIKLGEIEARLRGCAGVRDAVVVAGEDREGRARLVAYTVAERDGPDLMPTALRRALAGVLPEYMLPGAFVQMEALPLTSRGKVDRRALPAPDQAALASRPYEAPRGEAEIALAAIWQELLNVPAVGRHDHFFELGGHSLLAVRLAARVRECSGRSIGLGDLFSCPTVMSLAQRLEGMSAQGGTPALVVLRDVPGAPQVCFFHAIDGGVRYVAELAPWIDGNLSVVAFEAFALVRDGSLPHTLEELAALYLKLIQARQEKGLVALAGWSAGGLLAYEVARQLAQADGEAPRLVLIDSPAGYGVGPVGGDDVPAPPPSALERAYVDAFLERMVPGASARQRRILADLVDDHRQDLLDACRRRGLPVSADEAASLVEMLETHDRVGAMMEKYVIRSSHLAPYQLLAETGEPLDPAAWERVLGKALRADVVAGDHYTMLKGEGAQRIGALISRYVNDADSRCRPADAANLK